MWNFGLPVFEINEFLFFLVFQTFVNGRNFVNFDHRLDKGRICHVVTKGNANFFQPEFF